MFLIMLNTIVNTRSQLNTDRFHFNCSLILVVVFVNYFIYLIYINVFDAVMFFKVPINLSVTTDFPSLPAEWVLI